MQRIRSVLAVLSLAVPALSVAAVLNDEVTSAKLKEADNTASQDTNSGAGVKTNHIQNKAVTSAKLADGAVGSSQLAPAAVTDANIAGPVSRSKLQRIAGYAVVARSGGDYLTPQAAMADLSTWCGAPSALTPCLLKIMPGTYQMGAQQLVMQPFVDVEGAGEGVTILAGNSSGPLVQGAAAELRDITIKNVATSANVGVGVRNVATLRRATVLVSSSTTMNIGVEATGGVSVLEDVRVSVSGSWGGEAIKGAGGSLVLRNVRAAATGIADGEVTAFFALGEEHWLSNVELTATSPSGSPTAMIVSWSDSGPALAQVHARAVVAVASATSGGSYGIQVVRGNLWLDGSLVSGSTASVSAGWAFAGSAFVASSRMEGGPVTRYTADSTAVCSGVTDEAYVFYPNQCP